MNIVSPQNAETFRQVIKSSQISLMGSSRHFPMIDEPDHFIDVVVKFLEDQPLQVESDQKSTVGAAGGLNNGLLVHTVNAAQNGSGPKIATDRPLPE